MISWNNSSGETSYLIVRAAACIGETSVSGVSGISAGVSVVRHLRE